MQERGFILKLNFNPYHHFLSVQIHVLMHKNALHELQAGWHSEQETIFKHKAQVKDVMMTNTHRDGLQHISESL